MIELTVFEWLKKNLPGVKVCVEEPKGVKGKFVLVEKTGGTESIGLNSATFAVQAYSDTRYEAAELNEKVKEAMYKMAESNGGVATKVELNSDYNFTDLNTKRYRFQSVYDITYYKN